MMKYKGFFGHAEYDDEAKAFCGKILGLKESIIFQGNTVEGLELSFRTSIDTYLILCEQKRRKTGKNFLGHL